MRTSQAAPADTPPQDVATAEAASDRILALLDQGESDRAAAAFREAFARWPETPRLLLTHGELLARTEGPGPAIGHYASLLGGPVGRWAAARLGPLLRSHPPEAGLALQIAGAARSLQGEDAERLVEALLSGVHGEVRRQIVASVAPWLDTPRMRWRLIVQNAEGGRTQEALDALERASVEEGLRTPQADILRAELLVIHGREAEAAALLRETAATNPDHVELHRQLIAVLQQAGRHEEAEAAMLEAAARWPRDWFLIFRLNRLPVSPEGLKTATGHFAKGSEVPGREDDRHRLHFALACLHAGEIEKGLELLGRPFPQSLAHMADPVCAAAFSRPAAFWRETTRLADDRRKDVQITRATDAKATVIVPTGISFGYLPLSFVDSLLAAHQVNAIYLRDFNKRAYLRGVVGLGASEAETIDALERLLDELGPTRRVVMGSSSGGFSAMRLGGLIGAHAAISFSGRTTLLDDEEKASKVSIWDLSFMVQKTLRQEPDLPVDLVPLIAATPHVRYLQVFGADEADDAMQAGRIEAFANVELRPIAGFNSHVVVDHLIADGRFDRMLAEAIG